MARSTNNNALAFPAEVARYLCLEPADVERLMAKDALPYFSLPKVKRTVKRIPLREFHAWLRGRAKNHTPSLNSFETFLADFESTRAA